jgi:hypothetical protein
MDREGHAGPLAKASNQRMEALRRHRRAALGSEHVRPCGLLPLQSTHCADFVTLERMHARRPALATAHTEPARGKLDLVPLEITHLRRPQTMPVRDQDHGGVAVPVPAAFPRRRPDTTAPVAPLSSSSSHSPASLITR